MTNLVAGNNSAGTTARAGYAPHLPWLSILGGWLALSLLTTAQRYFLTRSAGGGPGFLLFFGWTAALWAFWAGAAPLVFWLGGRLPLRRETLHWALPAHFGCAVLLGLLHLAFWTALGMFIEASRTGQREQFWTEYLRILQVLFYVELLLYGALLGAGLARAALREAHERAVKAQALEAQLQQAQLAALKQQLQPHFLFNALNTVAMLVRNDENQQAVQMIARLGELLRWSLNENAAPEVTLAAELEAVQRYLAIEQFRFPDRLRVELAVPPDVLHAAVPNLILQPLVENAVRHGIAKLSTAGLIRISARREGEALELLVEDDGAGFSREWQAGVGLSNVRARLTQAYGAQADMTVAQREPQGASVRLRLPYFASSDYGNDQNAHRG